MSIFELVKAERARRGLKTRRHPVLQFLADRQAHRMAAEGVLSHDYSHEYPEVCGYCGPTPQEAFDMWMGSPPHRQILLSNWVYAGFGWTGENSTWWCGNFAVERPE